MSSQSATIFTSQSGNYVMNVFLSKISIPSKPSDGFDVCAHKSQSTAFTGVPFDKNRHIVHQRAMAYRNKKSKGKQTTKKKIVCIFYKQPSRSRGRLKWN